MTRTVPPRFVAPPLDSPAPDWFGWGPARRLYRNAAEVVFDGPIAPGRNDVEFDAAAKRSVR